MRSRKAQKRQKSAEEMNHARANSFLSKLHSDTLVVINRIQHTSSRSFSYLPLLPHIVTWYDYLSFNTE